MNKLLFAALMLLAVAAMAQQPKPPAEDLEPGVNTSAPAARPASTPAAARPAPAAPPQQSGAAAGSGAKGSASKGSAAAGSNNPAGKPAAQAGAKGNAKDRLDLDSTQITGNRELPKVLYIVPWRSAELGDLVGRPVNSLLDEVLEPIDRDVFRRQNRYFEALQPNGAAPASKPEK
jgi:hypothetical protein